jgi:hypothetical protein
MVNRPELTVGEVEFLALGLLLGDLGIKEGQQE